MAFWAIRTGLVLAGYIIAVLIASGVSIVARQMLAAMPNGGSLGYIPSLPVIDLAGIYVGAAMLTGLAALPGFLLVVYLAHRLAWRGCLPFAVAGSLNVVLSFLLLFTVMTGSPGFGQIDLVASCLLGGLAGGVVYWLVAGRRMRAA